MYSQEEKVESQKVRKHSFPLWIVAVLIFLLVFSLTLALLWVLSDSEDEDLGKVEPKIHKLEGEMYLTLSPLDFDEPNLYRLELPSFNLEPIFEGSEHRNSMASFSPDSENMVFVRGYDEDWTSQLLILQKDTQEIVELTSRLDTLLRNPEFSKDGDSVVYWAYEGDESPIPWGLGYEAEENTIYLMPIDGDSQKIANGVYPIFIEENVIAFIKNDGLYSLNLDTMEETLMLELFEEGSFITMPDNRTWSWGGLRVDYSSQESMLSIADFVNEKIHFFEVESLNPFEYSEVHTLDGDRPHWPVFSPTGDYFVVLEFQKRGTSYPFLSFFYLDETLPKRIDSFGLRDYDIGYISSPSWIVE